MTISHGRCPYIRLPKNPTINNCSHSYVQFDIHAILIYMPPELMNLPVGWFIGRQQYKDEYESQGNGEGNSSVFIGAEFAFDWSKDSVEAVRNVEAGVRLMAWLTDEANASVIEEAYINNSVD